MHLHAKCPSDTFSKMLRGYTASSESTCAYPKGFIAPLHGDNETIQSGVALIRQYL